MVAAKIIENKIARMKPSRIFTVDELGFPPHWRENVRIKLGRMVKSGQIEKGGRGKYYKPKASVFGNIGPHQSEVLRDLMYDNGVLSGYITGYAIWNKMGLTSQVSNAITVGTSHRHDPMKRGHYQVRFIMQANRITSASIPLLQILDSLKMIKQIPDTTVDRSAVILKKHIADLDAQKLRMLVKLSGKYPPRVRALLGAILESAGNHDYTAEIKATLNPSTTYTIGLSKLSEVDLNNWNIE